MNHPKTIQKLGYWSHILGGQSWINEHQLGCKSITLLIFLYSPSSEANTLLTSTILHFFREKKNIYIYIQIYIYMYMIVYVYVYIYISIYTYIYICIYAYIYINTYIYTYLRLPVWFTPLRSYPIFLELHLTRLADRM